MEKDNVNIGGKEITRNNAEHRSSHTFWISVNLF